MMTDGQVRRTISQPLRARPRPRALPGRVRALPEGGLRARGAAG